MSGLNQTRVENLILARLLVTGASRPSVSTLRKDIGKCVEHRLTTSEWNAELEQRLESLSDADLIKRQPLNLTPAGEARVMEWLGMKTRPARLDWRKLKAAWLAPATTGAVIRSDRDRDRISKGDGLRAFVLKSEYDLATDECPTMSKALDALLWKDLFGIETNRKLSIKAIAEQVLSQKLNVEPSLGRDRLLAQLPASILQAAQTSPDHLRLAAIRNWLDDSDANDLVPASKPTSGLAVDETAPKPAATEDGPRGQAESADCVLESPAESNEVTLQNDIHEFAQRAKQAARDCQTGRFGERKVFISHVWSQLVGSSEFSRCDLPDFKQQLVEANRVGLLALSRADLVEAMDPQDVAESQTEHLNSEFHFVRTDTA